MQNEFRPLQIEAAKERLSALRKENEEKFESVKKAYMLRQKREKRWWYRLLRSLGNLFSA